MAINNKTSFETGLELPEQENDLQAEVASSPGLPEKNEQPAKSVEFAGGERNPELMKSSRATSSAQAQSVDDSQLGKGQSSVSDDDFIARDSNGNPQIADDVELIEKEWVDKAKELIAKTQNDPSQQSIELQKIKADYIKKRFNKQLKIKKEG